MGGWFSCCRVISRMPLKRMEWWLEICKWKIQMLNFKKILFQTIDEINIFLII